MGPGTVSFWWQAYSEQYRDWLEFYVGSDLVASICGGDAPGGGSGWQYCSFAVPAGTNLLTWRYAKDESLTGGTLDYAQVDQVSYVTSPPPPLQQALNTYGVAWSTTGSLFTNGWFSQTNVTHDGQWAAQSGAISHNQTNWLQATVSGITNVSFWWAASSHTNKDFLEFYTNGVLARQISGVTTWQSNNFKLPSGTNILTWLYRKNPYWTLESDCGWVDEVAFSPPIKAPTNSSLVTLSSTINPAMFGQAVIFTASVSAAEAGAGTPSGTVQFKTNGVNFGSAVTLSGGNATSSAIAHPTSGQHHGNSRLQRERRLQPGHGHARGRPDGQPGNSDGDHHGEQQAL